MKTVSIGDFKRLNSEGIKKLGCFRVTYEGELMGIWLAPLTPYAVEQGEHIATLTNAAKGVIDEEVKDLSPV